MIILRERFARFMYGRNGADSLSWFTLIVGVILMLLASFFSRSFLVTLLTLASYALLIYTLFRILSKNTAKRAQENAKYNAQVAVVKNWFNGQRRISDQRKDYHIYKCPTCKQKIRIPKGKGRIEIRCPKCNTTFIKNS